MPSVEYTQSKGLFQKSSSKDASGNLLPELNLKGELFGYRHKVLKVNSTTELSASDSGAVVLLTPGNAPYNVDLPNLDQNHYDDGVRFTFILTKNLVNGQADDNAIHIRQKDVDDEFLGSIIHSAAGADGDVARANGADVKITFNSTAGADAADKRAQAGDRIEVESTKDLKWFVTGASSLDAGVEFA